MKTIGQEIKEIVSESDETLKDILEGADVSKKAYYKIVDDKNHYSDGFDRLCAYLHIKIRIEYIKTSLK